MTGRTSRSLPEENLASVALQEERLRHVEAVEHLDDVAVLQHELRSAGALMVLVTQRLRLGDDLELRERRAFERLGAEVPHDRAAGAQHTDDLLGERLRGGRLEEVEDIPAEHAVDARVLLHEALHERFGERVARAVARVPVDFGREILDEQLAPELLAEERD